MSRFLMLALVLMVGCKDKTDAPASVDPAPKPTTTPPAGSAGSAATGSATGSAAAGSATPNDPVPATKPAPKDLPAFGGSASAAAKKRATELADLSLGAQAGMNEEDAVAKAVAAVKEDPGSALARFAVACAAGDEAFDLAQLTPLTTATGCAECVDLIRNLAMADFYDCSWSAGVKALATKVKPSAQRIAAEALITSLTEGDPKPAAPYFTAPSVEIALDDAKTKAAGAKQLAKLVDQVKKAKAEDGMGDIVINGGLTCAADCCEVEDGQLQHNHDFFRKVCFKPGTDQVRRIDLVSGG